MRIVVKSVFLVFLMLVLSLSVATNSLNSEVDASGSSPKRSDYEIDFKEENGDSAMSGAWNFSDYGFYYTTGESCDELKFGKGNSLTWIICDYQTQNELFRYSTITRLTPLMYNDTILLVNGEQLRPDFGEKNEIFGIDITSWQISFIITSPWQDGGTIQDAIVSPSGQYVSFVRGGCTQIWDMNTMSNAKLFSGLDSSSAYCAGVRHLFESAAFSPDNSVYVGYEPNLGGLAAYSTSNWTKLGFIQESTTVEQSATKFTFTPGFAYYIEEGGYEEHTCDNDMERRNKIIKIDLSNISNLWNEQYHSELFFGASNADLISGVISGFSNIQTVKDKNRVVITNLYYFDSSDLLVLRVREPLGDYGGCFYNHYRGEGYALITHNGTIFAEYETQSSCHKRRDCLSIIFNDFDGDLVGDRSDALPRDPTQYSDRDGDGKGDNLSGSQPDLFPDDPTQSSDSDGDGYGDNPLGNNSDVFPYSPSQWNDIDADGYGDNLDGFQGDNCPTINGNSFKDSFGCIDSDGDGYSDDNDSFDNDYSQWSDVDEDGYGDNNTGENSDACVGDYGTSTIDRLGCPDQDGDGLSDLNDPYPFETSDGSVEGKSSSADSVKLVLATISVTLLVIISVVGVIFIRKRNSDEDEDEDEYEDEGEEEDEGESEYSDEPNYSMRGEINDDGWEVLEYPSGSGRWWWKDQENHCWQSWD